LITENYIIQSNQHAPRDLASFYASMRRTCYGRLGRTKNAQKRC